jgi:hypothetical protein
MPRLWRSGVDTGDAAIICHSGTFEPWLGGDRQTQKRMAKARHPLQTRVFEVSLS